MVGVVIPDRKENEFTEATGPSANMFGLEPMMILLHSLGSNFFTDLVIQMNMLVVKVITFLIIYTNIKHFNYIFNYFL